MALPGTMRVVLDTNVLISAYRFGGKPRAILELAHRAEFLNLTSKPLKEELEGVLAEKFFMADELIEALCSPLWKISDFVEPKTRITLCLDEPDNRVLECAVEGGAQFIVTGDKHLLNLPPIEGIAILKPDAFLDAVAHQQAGE